MLAIAAFGLRLSFDPGTLDWNMGDVPIHVINNVVEGLYEVNSKGAIVANEAKGFPNCKSENPAKDLILKCTIKLKTGLRWSDHKPVTAADYVYSWNRLRDSKTGSTYRDLLKDYSEFEAVDTETIRYTANTKDVSVFTHWTTFPMREDSKKVYNGPYTVSQIEPSVKYVLVPNTEHRKPGKLPLIHALVITDDTAALSLYLEGKLHFISDLNPFEKNVLRKRDDYHKQRSPVLVYLAIHHNEPRLQQEKIRNALFEAIDRKHISEVLNTEDQPTETVSPFKNSKISNLKKNQIELKNLDFGYFEKGSNRTLIEFLQANFKTNTGTTFNLQSNEVKTYWARLKEKPYSIFLNTYGPPVWNERFYYELFLANNPMNMGRYKSDAYDSAVLNGDFRKAQSILDKEKPVIPLYFRTYEYLLSKKVSGAELNPMTSLKLQNAEFIPNK